MGADGGIDAAADPHYTPAAAELAQRRLQKNLYPPHCRRAVDGQRHSGLERSCCLERLVSHIDQPDLQP